VTQEQLRADCARCAGLCCVAPAFAASADFAIDKPAGQACPNLGTDSRCGIHPQLRRRGFTGCTVFDCFGAGQQVVQVTFGGRDWRESAGQAREMFDAFTVMRQLHELLWYLTEALARPESTPIRAGLVASLVQTRELTALPSATLRAVDVAGHREQINVLLTRTSELVRAPFGRGAWQRRGADLVGADLRRRDLRGANLRGAYLIAADLRGVDLTGADLIGADLRDADLRGAALAGALFLTQFQLNAARGDARTTVPAGLDRPGNWPS